VLQPSPLKEISPRDYEGREVIGEQRMIIEPRIWSQRHESRLDYFLNFRVGIVTTINEILQTETCFRVGSTLTTTAWQKRMKEAVKVICEPQEQ
jgi:hypothetical protein